MDDVMLPEITARVIGSETQAIDGRDIHAKLEIKRQYANWAPEQIERADLAEGVDYVCLTNMVSKEGRGGHNRIDYVFTLDAAKNICLMSQTELGKAYRKALIELEKQVVPSAFMPGRLTPAASDMEGLLKIAEMMGVPKHYALIEATKQIERDHGVELQPMLRQSEYLDAIPSHEKMLEPTELGKLWDLNGAGMNKVLAKLGMQSKHEDRWEPTERGLPFCSPHSWSVGTKSGYNLKWNVVAIREMLEQEPHLLVEA